MRDIPSGVVRVLFSIAVICACVSCEEIMRTDDGKPIPPEAIERTIRGAQKFFTELRDKGPRENLGARDIFSRALLLAELKQDLDALDKAFEIAESMQDLNPESRTFGNFRWYWHSEAVGDQNAVEFSMQDGGLLYKRHRDALPPGARERLERMMRNSIKGILSHNVQESYTNIFIMKTWNLICLGETLGLPEIAEQGYEHLDRFVVQTAENGICEYLSPTYYGTDLDSLDLIATFTERERGRKQAKALLTLFWNDIAANWYEPARRLGGAHSRDYDYLTGHGYLEGHLMAACWVPQPEQFSIGGGMLFHLLSTFKPDPQWRKSSLTRFPRLVQQSWGGYWYQTATNYLTKDYLLATAGAGYHTMDKPLVVLFADPDLAGAYYLMDARRDPYGRVKLPEGKSGHMKALHLRPFLTTVQERDEALLLAAPTEDRYKPESDYLASHLVLPVGVEQCFVGGRQVDATKEFSVVVKLNEPVLLVHKGAILGVKIPAAKALDGAEAKIELVRDSVKDKAMRLTVTHYAGPARKIEPEKAMVALWVRMAAEEDFAAFRESFASAKFSREENGGLVRLSAKGMRTDLAIEADLANQQRIDTTVGGQRPKKFLLAVDGEDIGRKIMDKVPPVSAYRKAFDAAQTVIESGRPSCLEAEAAFSILKPMQVSEDPNASGGKFIWMPGEVGGKGGSSIGRAVWPMQVKKAGTYYLWARVLTPSPDDDSFFVSVDTEGGELVPRSAWHTGTHPEWTWVRVSPENAPADWLKLPQGKMRLVFWVREDASRLDKLFISDSPDVQPEPAPPTGVAK